MQQFIGFFHNGQIGTEIGIKDKSKAARLGGSHQSSFAAISWLTTKHFGNGHPDRRRGLQYHHDFRIAQGPHDPRRMIDLFDGTGGTKHRALSTRDAIRLAEGSSRPGRHAGGSLGNAYHTGHTAAGQGCFQYFHALQLVTGSDAPRTANAQGGIVGDGIGTGVNVGILEPMSHVFNFQTATRRKLVVGGKPLQLVLIGKVQIPSEGRVGEPVEGRPVDVDFHGRRRRVVGRPTRRRTGQLGRGGSILDRDHTQTALADR